jgi:hypothetical protein
MQSFLGVAVCVLVVVICNQLAAAQNLTSRKANPRFLQAQPDHCQQESASQNACGCKPSCPSGFVDKTNGDACRWQCGHSGRCYGKDGLIPWVARDCSCACEDDYANRWTMRPTPNPTPPPSPTMPPVAGPTPPPTPIPTYAGGGGPSGVDLIPDNPTPFPTESKKDDPMDPNSNPWPLVGIAAAVLACCFCAMCGLCYKYYDPNDDPSRTMDLTQVNQKASKVAPAPVQATLLTEHSRRSAYSQEEKDKAAILIQKRVRGIQVRENSKGGTSSVSNATGSTRASRSAANPIASATNAHLKLVGGIADQALRGAGQAVNDVMRLDMQRGADLAGQAMSTAVGTVLDAAEAVADVAEDVAEGTQKVATGTVTTMTGAITGVTGKEHRAMVTGHGKQRPSAPRKPLTREEAAITIQSRQRGISARERVKDVNRAPVPVGARTSQVQPAGARASQVQPRTSQRPAAPAPARPSQASASASSARPVAPAPRKQ